jgi:hypothetical protein
MARGRWRHQIWEIPSCGLWSGSRGQIPLRRLDPVDGILQLLLVLLVISHHRLQRLNARLEWLQWFQLQLNVVQAVHDGIERGLDDVP